MTIDIYALSFLIVSIVGMVFAIAGLFICSYKNNTYKRIAIATAVLTTAFFIPTLMCSSDALEKYKIVYQAGRIVDLYIAPTSDVTVALGIITVILGIISFVISIISKSKPNKVVVAKIIEETADEEDAEIEKQNEEPEEMSKESNDVEDLNEEKEESKPETEIIVNVKEENQINSIKEKTTIINELKVSDKETIILTASSNTGIGFWTSICVSFASVFGVVSRSYKKKMDMILSDIKDDLENQMKEYPNYDFKDYRIIKERGLAYYGTVIGYKKKN